MVKIWNKFTPLDNFLSNGASTSLKRKVFVGLSGGVDSSVAALLLKEAGHEVTGVFIKIWEPEFAASCTALEDERAAIRTAAALGIPFFTLDLSDLYRKEVVEEMLAEYRVGRTPNPDVLCNRSIKFGAFFAEARRRGADYIATGHYARTELRDGKPALFAGADREKDQSYFLWRLEAEALKHAMFPIGEMTKREVRALAKERGLPSAMRKDSQGLCFIGSVDVKAFLAEHVAHERGAVLDTAGRRIGEHRGARLYTIGERHGFLVEATTPADGPRYVVSKDVEQNTITVAEKQERDTLGSRDIRVHSIHWLRNVPDRERAYGARVRYRQPLQDCRIELLDTTALVRFNEPQHVAPGQSLVLYDGEECLGGGVIA